MTQQEWRRKKAEMALRTLQRSATKMVAELGEDFDAASAVAKIVQAAGEARALMASSPGARRVG